MSTILKEFNPLQDLHSLKENGPAYAALKHTIRGALAGVIAGATYALVSSENVETGAAIGAGIGLYLDHIQSLARQILADAGIGEGRSKS
jgi:hypothetical protein